MDSACASNLNEESDQLESQNEAIEKLKSKVEITDAIFHPKENNIITLGLINGKIKM
jgi:hypothetical protein